MLLTVASTLPRTLPYFKKTFSIAINLFDFQEKAVLKLIDLVADSNSKQTITVKSPTGSGKTTILSLICRNYDIQKGEILIDGINIKKIKISSLRRHFGQMLQDVFLFSDTVEGNVAFGNQELTMDEVKDFANRAAAHDFIEKLSEGYDTIIGDRGCRLSGGQRQAVTLLMASMNKPKLLLLDEIITRYYYQKGSIEASLNHDKEVKRAIEILKNKEEYNKILGK